MRIRSALLLSIFLLGAPTVAQAQTQTSRNVFGQPDLSGDWSNASLTPLTRNRNISDKPRLTAEEARRLEVEFAKALSDDDQPISDETTTKEATDKFLSSRLVQLRPDLASAASGGAVGGYNTFWIDPGTRLVEINGEYRTSIVTTPDGQIPRRKAGAPTRSAPQTARGEPYDSYENRPATERCLTFGAGSNKGPPMLSNGYYNNSYQIVQGRNEVAILVELIHDVRIIRLNSAHRTDGFRPSMGDSIGRYEGNTLVIETTNIPENESFQGSWRNLKVTEWLTRVSRDKLLYRFQIEDPDTWDQPWGGEGVFNALKNGGVFEYACHEGNYALENVLAGARLVERQERERAAANPPAPNP